jgi:hypothetical protein
MLRSACGRANWRGQRVDRLSDEVECLVLTSSLEQRIPHALAIDSDPALVEATDTPALVAAILTLHRDPARAATLGASGRAYAARFAPEPIAAEWEEIYGEVLLRARPRRASASRSLPQPTARRS